MHLCACDTVRVCVTVHVCVCVCVWTRGTHSHCLPSWSSQAATFRCPATILEGELVVLGAGQRDSLELQGAAVGPLP